jgi:hypothetical protein
VVSGYVLGSRFEEPFRSTEKEGFTVQYGMAFPETCEVRACDMDAEARTRIRLMRRGAMWMLGSEAEHVEELIRKGRERSAEGMACRKYWKKWLTSEKLWMGFVEEQGWRRHVGYTVLFMPNTEENVDIPNVVVREIRTGKTTYGKTGTVTPRGPEGGSLALKIVAVGDTANVYYGEKGAYLDAPVVTFCVGEEGVEADRVFFAYHGGRWEETEVRVDNISITGNTSLVHRTDSEHTFSEALYASDGNNLTDTFEVADLRQSTYQLYQDIGGVEGLPEWFGYANTIQTIASGTEKINGIPLIMAYAKYHSLTQGNEPEERTFFMATANRDTVRSRSVNFIFAYGSEYSTHEETIEEVKLEIEGNEVLLDSVTSAAAYEFSSAGEKTIKVSAKFDSGFIGENLFKLMVTPMDDGTWYNENFE